MDIQVSVVVPTLNRAKDLRECLEALGAQDFDAFEVIVVDGGSGDGTADLLSALEKDGIRYLTEKAPGAAAARNRGIEASRARFIAFTDDDCVPGRSWLSDLLKSLPEDRKCAGVGGKVIPFRRNIVSEFAESRGMGRAVCFGRQALHIPTTNAMYRKKALLDAGSFDCRLIYAEDTNLSLRVLKKGYYLRWVDSALVKHKDPTTIQSLYQKAWNYGYGLASISGIEGKPLDLGKVGRIRNLREEKTLSFARRAAFSALGLIQAAGIRAGFAAGAKSHISSR